MKPEPDDKGKDTRGGPCCLLGIVSRRWLEHSVTLILSLHSSTSSVLSGKQTSRGESQPSPSDRHKLSCASAWFRPSANDSWQIFLQL